MDIAVYDLIQYQNADFRQAFQWTVRGTGETFDWSASTFEMDIKTTGSGSVVLAATLDTTDADESTIGITVLDGSIAVGDYVYDLVRIAGATRELLMTGNFHVRQGVTQP
jgi:hypothetical protein